MKSCADKPHQKPQLKVLTAVRNIKSLGTKHPVAVGQLPLATEQNFFSGFEIYFHHTLNDLYRYPLFCSPQYKLGAAINLDSGLRYSGDIALRIADGYAASPYIDSLILKLSARFTF